MEIAATGLWLIGATVFIVLGGLHLCYTFFTNKFESRSNALNESMKAVHPKLTRQTTMLKAWVGFNASHSSGSIFIGFINFYVAIRYSFFLHDFLFLVFNIATVGFYVWLAKRYWFNIPFRGLLITLACYLVVFVLTAVAER